MARKKKSSFYHLRSNKLQIGPAIAAEVLGVTVETIQEYDDHGAPVMAERLLWYWDKKYVGHEGWDGFYFSRGKLCHRKQAWGPFSLFEYHRREKRMTELEHEISQLKTLSGAWANLRNVTMTRYSFNGKHAKGNFPNWMRLIRGKNNGLTRS